ncbi:MAG: protein translocase subunit SecD [Proteobacteria bacterium]|nr:protein translocase subunit SecD [Pseudomonadota bacterium]MCP4920147.1 protein translocase subunit SecD [Pseudomonadota bacterium]
MAGSWWVRIGVIALAVLASIYSLLPTFMQDTEAVAKASLQGVGTEQVEEVEVTGWQALLPDTVLVLGLDLQGGLDLTLDVGVEEAILSSVSRDVQSVYSVAETEGIELTSVRRTRGEPQLEVGLANEDNLDELQSMMATKFRTSKGFPTYEYKLTGAEGGLHVFELTDDQAEEIKHQSMEQALETLRKRVNETGVKEPSIVRKGDRRINIQLPGVSDLDTAFEAIGTSAILEFFMVDEDFDQAALEKAILAGEQQLSEEEYNDDDALNEWLVATGRIGRNNRVLWEYADTPEGGSVRNIPYALIDKIELTGDDVNDAQTGWDQFNRPVVLLRFKPAGGQRFGDLTGDNVGKRFAIVLDREVESAPNINERISGGSAQISMGAADNAQNEARMLAMVLRTGALPAPVTVGDVRLVGPQLGQDSIDAGRNATLIGGILVIFAMAFYYRKIGLVANLALTLNVLFVMAMLAAFGATLTLPGIAGIVLTVGMAVDANIIIYERIREELAVGKNARSAVDAGYQHALSAVLDANITTGIAGIVLYSYGTGPIKGFAVTLLIGIMTTLFTAIFVSRTFMDFVVRKSSARLAF